MVRITEKANATLVMPRTSHWTGPVEAVGSITSSSVS